MTTQAAITTAGLTKHYPGVQALSDELLPAMKMVMQAKTNHEVYYERFRNFVDFFEAILAYHRANGGSNN